MPGPILCQLTPDAIDLGLDATLSPVIELESKIGETGRDERACPSDNHLSVVGTIRLARHDPSGCRSSEKNQVIWPGRTVPSLMLVVPG
jgi:hypothetical protein